GDAPLRARRPRLSRQDLGGRPGNGGGFGERSGGARRQPRCQMAARFALLRRAFRYASSVVAALAALAPRLVRLAHHHYPDGLLAVRRRTMGKLEGKTALVTGGGRGIGRGIVVELAREGADVAINYRRDREAAEATAAEVRAVGRRALALQADVGEREAVEAMVAHAVEFLGGL